MIDRDAMIHYKPGPGTIIDGIRYGRVIIELDHKTMQCYGDAPDHRSVMKRVSSLRAYNAAAYPWLELLDVPRVGTMSTYARVRFDSNTYIIESKMMIDDTAIVSKIKQRIR